MLILALFFYIIILIYIFSLCLTIQGAKYMNKNEIFQTMIALFQYCGISVLPFNAQYDGIDSIDFSFRKKLSPNFQYNIIAEDLEQRLPPDQCCLFEDELNLNYIFIRFSPEYEKELGCHTLCIGPMLFHAPDEASIRAFMENYSISLDYLTDFIEFYNLVPLIPSYDLWIRQITFFFSQLYGYYPKFTHVHWNNIKSTPPSPEVSATPKSITLDAIATRYTVENKLMTAVAAGNAQEAENLYFEFRQFRLMPRISDPIRDQKNLLFTLNTLMRKAAEYGQVHPFYIDRLSTQLAIQIEHCSTLKQVKQMGRTVVRKYCILVHNYSRRAYSSLVQTCMNYIDFYYNTDLSLSSLAKLCSISHSYLSVLFKKETGMTVTDYINQTRIRQALTLLNTTNMPIGEIAEYCGFMDANYFSRIFKKMQGLSPRQYRSSIQLDGKYFPIS